jgi:hypothetical protein
MYCKTREKQGNMTENITNPYRWKPGQSGNPKGRPRRKQALAELLRQRGEAIMVIGSEEISGQEALAEAVWQLAINGEVWLGGRQLMAESVNEWASVVKWLINTIEPPITIEPESEPEVVIRVVREDRESDLTQRRKDAKEKEEGNYQLNAGREEEG